MIQYDEENANLIPKKEYSIKKLLTAEDPINQEEEEIITKIKNYIEKNVYIWDTTNSEHFNFSLPSTMFGEDRKINFKAFEEATVSYDDSYISRALTSDQLGEIWKAGQFQVKSKIPSKPYVWKLSEWLHKGRENINASFCWDFGRCFYFLWMLKERFSLRRDKRFANSIYAIRAIFFALKDLWGILFGRVRYSWDYIQALRYPDSYLYPIVLRNYHIQLVKDHPEIVTSIYKPKFQQIVTKLQTDFELKWTEEKILLEHELREQDLTAKEIKQKLSDIRFSKLIECIQNCPKFNDGRKSYFIDSLKSERIYSKIQFEYSQKYQELEKQVRKEITEGSPIRSTVSEWFEKEVSRRMKEKREMLEEEVNTQIESELDSYPVHKMLIKSWRNFIKCKKQSMDLALEEKKTPYQFSLYKNILPPYEVESHEYDNYGVKVKSYSLKRYKEIYIDTDFCFWRIKLLVYTMYVFWVHCFHFGYYMCWNWGFGLKAFCSKQIVKDYSIDCQTGVVSPSEKSFTYYSAIKDLFHSISKSREDYERAADQGFLGGKTGRVLNIIENYIIKLIFGGLIVLLIYPISILLLSTFFFILMLLGLIVMPLIAILGYFFCILIYDYNFPGHYHECACFPLIWIILRRLIGEFAFNLLFSIVATIGQILLTIVMFLWGILRWIARSLYDCVTYLLIKCNGNIPKANTSFAWRIAGPGISRAVFSQMDIQDALILIRATLEKMQLEHFEKKISDQISHPLNLHQTILTRTLYNVNGCLTPDKKLSESIAIYRRTLAKQLSARHTIYPQLTSQIRFTKDDLELLLEATHEIVKEFMKRNQMDDVWKLNGLIPNNWKLLTEKVMIRTFGSEDVLINVDESELVKEHKTNVIPQEIYEELGIHSAMKNARAKRSGFSFGTSSFKENDDYYYDDMNQKHNARVRLDEIHNANISPDTYVGDLHREHLRINLDQNEIKDEDIQLRQQNDQETDDKLSVN